MWRGATTGRPGVVYAVYPSERVNNKLCIFTGEPTRDVSRVINLINNEFTLLLCILTVCKYVGFSYMWVLIHGAGTGVFLIKQVPSWLALHAVCTECLVPAVLCTV